MFFLQVSEQPVPYGGPLCDPRTPWCGLRGSVRRPLSVCMLECTFLVHVPNGGQRRTARCSPDCLYYAMESMWLLFYCLLLVRSLFGAGLRADSSSTPESVASNGFVLLSCLNLRSLYIEAVVPVTPKSASSLLPPRPVEDICAERISRVEKSICLIMPRTIA